MGATYLRVSFRLLDERFHGRGSGGAMEWPPSPFRAWQALVAAAQALERFGQAAGAVEAVRSIERLEPPTIFVPASSVGKRVPTYVPNNDGDLVGRGSKSLAELRTSKIVATRTLADERITYAWRVAADVDVVGIQRAARSVAYLGWGMDLAIADADLCEDADLAAIPGERWVAGSAGKASLRVPAAGSLDDLEARHQEFLARLAGEELAPPSPASVFRRVGYSREGEQASGHTACYVLRDPGGGNMASFDPARSGLRVAGMLRGASHTAALAQGWPAETARRVVLGHGGDDPCPHLGFIPLPTIEHRGDGKTPVVGAVRRVLIVAPTDDPDATEWAQRLGGVELVDEHSGEIRAILEPVATGDNVLRSYVGAAAEWATVTPVVLPGHADKGGVRKRLRTEADPERRASLQAGLDRRIDSLIRKAIVQAGLGDGLAALAELWWQAEPYWRGGAMAQHYGVPSHVRGFPVFHVRIRWRDEVGRPVEVKGPVCVGRGRFYGVGLFASKG